MRTNNPNNRKSDRKSDSRDSRSNSSFDKKGRTGGFKKSTDSSNKFEARSSAKPRFGNDSSPRKTGRSLDSFDKKDTSENPRFNKDRGNSFQPKDDFKPRFKSSDRPRREGFSKEGGYKSGERDAEQKPRFNKERDSSFQPRGEFKPRFKSSDKPRREGFSKEGGYKSGERDAEYKPRFNKERDNSFQPRDEFQPRFKSSDKPRRERFSKEGVGASEREGNVSFPKPIKRDADYNPQAKYSLKKQIEFKKQNLRANDVIRLNRFLSNAGICSRREADEFIKAGVVTVNGQIVTELGTKVSFTDKVMFHDQTVKSEKKVYILLNKPKDCVTTSDDPQERFTVMDLIKGACSERVYPVGRLDRNTTGVLLLTNDGDLAARLTHPKYNKKKIYHVYLDKNLTKADLETITNGIKLDDGEIHADQVSYVDETDKKQIGIEIHSGRNRIVRRIFEHLGYKVEKLDRVYFAGLTKKNISRGKYRFLTEKEVSMLNMGAFE